MKSNKRVIICILGIVILLLIISFIGTKITNEELEKDESKEMELTTGIALMLETAAGSGEYFKTEDTSWADVVARGYTFNPVKSTCKNGSTLTWNEENKTITLSGSVTDNCSAYFDVGKSIADYVIEKVGTTQGDGQIVNENGYRYEGANPNNYVSFNDELWRIIGVFDEETHGRSGEQLVKLIRAEKLPNYYQWDNTGDSGSNNWNTAVLKTMLNINYYNNTEINACSNYYTGSYHNNGKEDCVVTTVTDKGIKTSIARNMIQSINWKLGASSIGSGTANSNAFYLSERGTTPASSEGATAVSNEKLSIGLLYPSDYGYAALASDCPRTTNVGDYGTTSNCKNNNWISLLTTKTHWTLTPTTASNSVYFIFPEIGAFVLNNGTLYYSNNNFEVYPTLYLKQNVKITGGTGTSSDPYTLSM